jgi:hypothetical protein
MKRTTRHLISGMATLGVALSASSLGLPIPSQISTNAPSLDSAQGMPNALPWTPQYDAAAGSDRLTISAVTPIEPISSIWMPEAIDTPLGFSTLGAAVATRTPMTEGTLHPSAGAMRLSASNGPGSLSEPATLTLLALGLACLAIRNSLSQRHSRPKQVPVPGNAADQVPPARASLGSLVCVPPRDTRPFVCTPITRSHKARRRRRA